jgi:hypothetical protein
MLIVRTINEYTRYSVDKIQRVVAVGGAFSYGGALMI